MYKFSNLKPFGPIPWESWTLNNSNFSLAHQNLNTFQVLKYFSHQGRRKKLLRKCLKDWFLCKYDNKTSEIISRLFWRFPGFQLKPFLLLLPCHLVRQALLVLLLLLRVRVTRPGSNTFPRFGVLQLLSNRDEPFSFLGLAQYFLK